MAEFFYHIVTDIINSGEEDRIQELRSLTFLGLKDWCKERLDSDGVHETSRFRFTFLNEMFGSSSTEPNKLFTFIQDHTSETRSNSDSEEDCCDCVYHGDDGCRCDCHSDCEEDKEDS